MNRPKASEFDQELLDLYDDYAHGRISRRDMLSRAAKFAAAGMTAEALLATLSPNYAWAAQVDKNDPRISTNNIEYASPKGGGTIRGYLCQPKSDTKSGKRPAVLVIHENRGLNPYIEDVARRMAVAGFLALAPDALTPLGGYPGNDDEGRQMQRKRDPEKMTQDFIAAARWLDQHEHSTGEVGVVGFCFGGGMSNQLAVRIPEVIDAAVPFYGRPPESSEVAKIRAPLLFHFAEHDQRINEGWPAYEQALKEHRVPFEAHMYAGVNHGFHNDTTPRYDETAAKLAQERTIVFFNKHLQ